MKHNQLYVIQVHSQCLSLHSGGDYKHQHTRNKGATHAKVLKKLLRQRLS